MRRIDDASGLFSSFTMEDAWFESLVHQSSSRSDMRMRESVDVVNSDEDQL